MNNSSIKNLTIVLLSILGTILLYFIISTVIDGYSIWSSEKIDFAVTGQFGDFIGGFLGTIINGAAFYFLYLTLNEQRKSGEKQSFETKLYELIHLHRENVSELRYTKNNQTSEARKVFRVIVEEFMECFHEVKRFSKMYPDVEIFQLPYKNALEKIKTNNSCKANIKDLALIDIAFCCIYFGVSKESETILFHKFFHRYNKQYVSKLKIFLQLKPKKEDSVLYQEWKDFKGKEVDRMRESFEYIYNHRANPINDPTCTVLQNLNALKYYGGHQHRLGHYFRHLFQSFKFISLQDFLTDDEKYFYAKTIRAQLSTYEQFILFFNSLSSLGMKWEYTADISDLTKGYNINDFKLITRYNLIKNLPGSQYYDFTYRKYYPNVHFEYKDDITYL